MPTCITRAAISSPSLFKSEGTDTTGNTDGKEMKWWQGEEKKIKISQTRLKNAAGKSELSVSDSSGAVAIYNVVTQPESGRRRRQC